MARKIPIYLCCYHKSGTILLNNVFSKLCEQFGWSFKAIFGKCSAIPTGIDVVLFGHSLIDLDAVPTPFHAAHVIRDPRDVIVSGYLYHKRCQEAWCINTDFTPTEPILFPKVPASQQHRSEQWKRNYLDRLGNKSYQQNLLDRSESGGILFEMNHYGAWSIESMLNWNYGNPQVQEIRFEAIMRDFDGTFRGLFEDFEFSPAQIAPALKIAASEDIHRMTNQQIQNHPHISSRQTSKWQQYFRDVHHEAFQRKFGDALVKLGYESLNQG